MDQPLRVQWAFYRMFAFQEKSHWKALMLLCACSSTMTSSLHGLQVLIPPAVALGGNLCHRFLHTPCEHGEALPLLLQSFQAIRCAGISVPFGSTDQHVAASGPTLPCTLSTSPVLMVQRGTWGFARCNLCPDLNITVPCWDCRRFKGKFLLLCFWTVFEFHSKNDPVLLRVITALNSRPLTVTQIPCCWHQW